MKVVGCFVPVVAVAVFGASGADLAATDGSGLTLEQAYGPVHGVGKLVRWADKKGVKPKGFTAVAKLSDDDEDDDDEDDDGTVYDADHFTSRYTTTCNFNLDVVFVTDATVSVEGGAFANQLKVLQETVLAAHAGSRVGVVSFSDKPVIPYGTSNDYCYKVEKGLGGDLSAAAGAVGNITLSTGGDAWNNQLDAMVTAAADASLGWSAVQSKAMRLMVLLTGTPPHFALDGLNIAGLPAYRPVPGTCPLVYYPHPSHFLVAVNKYQVYNVVLLLPSLWQQLAYLNYLWLSKYVGFTVDFVAQLDSVNSLAAQLSSAIQVLKSVECTGVPEVLPTVEPTTIATEPTTVATVATTVTEPTTVATEPTTVATEPTTVATEPTTVATEPTTVATEPTTVATEPTTVATEPTTVATEPTTVVTEPTTVVTEPITVTSTTAATAITTEPVFTESTTEPTTVPTTVATETTTPAYESTPVATTVATETTTIVATEATTIATTEVEVTVTPVGTTEVSETAATEGECAAGAVCSGEGDCGCPEVVISLKEKPKHLELIVDNQ